MEVDETKKTKVMRKIVFRGKNRESGEWLYWSPFCCDSDVVSVENSWCVEPSTIGQRTELKDFNGVYIYEGDVLKHVSSSFSGVVTWHKAGYFYINDNDSDDSHTPLGEMLEIEDFVVVGNIFDNTELIETQVF